MPGQFGWSRAGTNLLFLVGLVSNASIAPGALGVVRQDRAWQPQDAAPGGEVIEFTAAEHDGVRTLYAAMSGALAVSDDSGKSWRTLRVPSPASAPFIAVEIEGDTIVAVTRAQISRVHRSFDRGVTWDVVDVPGLVGSIIEDGLALADGRLYAIGQADGAPFGTGLGSDGPLFVSEDFGETWNNADAPSQVVSVHAIGPIVIATPSAIDVGASFGKIYRSPDGGDTWDLVDLVAQGFGSGILGVTNMVSEGQTVFGISTGFGGDGVAWSDDAGLTWNPERQGTLAEELDVAVDDGTFYLLERQDFSGRVRRFVDGSWEIATPLLQMPFGGIAQHALAVVDGDAVVSMTPTLSIFVSEDGGAFERMADGMLHNHIFAMGATRSLVAANPINTAEVWFDDGSNQWRRTDLPRGVGGPVLEIGTPMPTMEPETFLVGTQTEGIFLTENGGDSWRAVNNGVPQYNGTAGQQFREIEAFTTDVSAATPTWYAGTGRGLEFIVVGGSGRFVETGGGIIRSADRGASWQTVNAGLPIFLRDAFGDPKFPPIMDMVAFDGEVLAGTRLGFGVFRLSDDGGRWLPSSEGLPEFGPNVFPEISGFALLDGAVYASLRGGGPQGVVFRSDDGGRTWTRADAGLPPLPALDIATVGDALYVSLSVPSFAPISEAIGVWTSRDGGASWTRAGSNLVGAFVNVLAGLKGTVYAAGAFQGVRSLARCAADCDGDGAATIFDFLCFQNLFDAGNARADLDGDGAFTLFDFLAFQDTFDAGCD